MLMLLDIVITGGVNLRSNFSPSVFNVIIYFMFYGSIVALITPFKDGEVDFKALENLIDFHINNHTDAILVCGTTGESPTLTFEEHEKVIEHAVNYAKGRIKVIAGTGANATHEAIELTTHAKKVGVDACLLVVPYYNKPTQEGLYQHFKTVADEVDIPIILYNIPSRTGVRNYKKYYTMLK